MEKMYQYLWRTAALGRDFRLTDGRKVHVANPGRQNFNAGPDFSSARITVNQTKWAGNVEIHLKASDWFHHGHDRDPAYDQVILHVVGADDRAVCRADGTPIPTLVLTVPEEARRLYSSLTSTVAEKIRCAHSISRLQPLEREDWLESLAIERLQEKADRILTENASLRGDWEQTCFVTLARGLGFGLNGTPFEMLARSIPLKFIRRHSDNSFQIEALLFGQAGMLDSSSRIFDEYYQQLCREYFFLARKYGLKPLNPSVWKYSRTRPQNFPHRRIAFLCKALEGGSPLMGSILDADTPERTARLFGWTLSGFWHTHFSFDAPAARVADRLGQASTDSLAINVAAPLLYAYAAQRGDDTLAERALRLLESLPPEKNSLTRDFESLDIHAHNAMRSQALVQLHKRYCDENRCLECRFSNRMIAAVAREASASYRPTEWT